MAGYKPLNIKGNKTGLVQERQEFILPEDAYPVLENAYVWRERIMRKSGTKFLGRLRRKFASLSLGLSNASVWTFNIFSTLVPPITPEPLAEIEPGSVVITIGVIVFTDQGDGTLTSLTPGNSGTINYITAVVSLTHTAGVGVATTINFNYFPTLPVMGLRTQEKNLVNNEVMVAFDTKYAYKYNAGFQEFIPGTTWTGTDHDFFWTTNYWYNSNSPPVRLFWVTNFDGTDPIRYTDGTTWFDFGPTGAPTTGQIDNTNFLTGALALLPFRGRLIAFNTLEGPNLAQSTAFNQRVRWAQIGNPLITYANPAFPLVATGSWRSDIRGKGGFLDLPTTESIVSVGFVRDNLVIYCERSTWQLRYTGRSIQPFQFERVNSELGAESTFSALQFDTSLVGIGDQGVVECDSFKSERIDVKIPNLVNQFNNDNFGPQRVYGLRDISSKLCYWCYPYKPDESIFPDRVLVYNYENDSWAIFINSFTCFGFFQDTTQLTWADLTDQWSKLTFQWGGKPSLFPSVMAGNQQGYVMYVGQQDLDSLASSEESLTIQGITGGSPTVITSPNHNLQTGQIIQIVNIPTGTPFATSLNAMIFQLVRVDDNNFQLWKYNPVNDQFNIPQVDSPATYIGGGEIRIRDNFSIISKKFNSMDEGMSIQMGYIDILMDTTENGAFSLNVYIDYDDDNASNRLPSNELGDTGGPDVFFNSVINTSASVLNVQSSSKTWQRIFCPTRANFLSLEYTLSNAQMVSVAQESDVQIDAQILWARAGGRLGI